MGREAVSPLHNFQLCALSILLLCDSYQSLQATIRLIIATITQYYELPPPVSFYWIYHFEEKYICAFRKP